MILAFDLLLLAGVSGCFVSRSPGSGIVIFSLGLFFLFQARRSRLLVGGGSAPVSPGRRVRAIAGAVLIAAAATPLLVDTGAGSGAFLPEEAADPFFPVTVVVVLLCAVLMLGLGVERRRR